MELPDLQKRFTDALLEDVRVGPRRECTLIVRPLVWQGQQGSYAERCVSVRFGAINNFNAVAAFFAGLTQQPAELQTIKYAHDPPSKPGRVYVNVALERMDEQLVIECQNLSIADADQH